MSDNKKEETKKDMKKNKTKAKSKRLQLPKEAVNMMKEWLYVNRYNAYPTEMQKKQLSLSSKLTLVQISNWFINARRRILPAMMKIEQDMDDQNNLHEFENAFETRYCARPLDGMFITLSRVEPQPDSDEFIIYETDMMVHDNDGEGGTFDTRYIGNDGNSTNIRINNARKVCLDMRGNVYSTERISDNYLVVRNGSTVYENVTIVDGAIYMNSEIMYKQNIASQSDRFKSLTHDSSTEEEDTFDSTLHNSSTDTCDASTHNSSTDTVDDSVNNISSETCNITSSDHNTSQENETFDLSTENIGTYTFKPSDHNTSQENETFDLSTENIGTYTFKPSDHNTSQESETFDLSTENIETYTFKPSDHNTSQESETFDLSTENIGTYTFKPSDHNTSQENETFDLSTENIETGTFNPFISEETRTLMLEYDSEGRSQQFSPFSDNTELIITDNHLENGVLHFLVDDDEF